MKVSVLHDRQGKIRSITQISPDTKFGVTIIAPRGFSVTEVELPPEFHQEPLQSVHATHRVDIREKKLVPDTVKKNAKREKRAGKAGRN
jgi:hypothetical protein